MADLVATDQALTLWINQHHCPVLDAVLMPVAWFGEAGIGWILVAALLLLFGRRRERLLTLVFLVGLAVTEYLLMPLLRDLWPRPRPYMYLEGIRQLGVRWKKFSFPSAHLHLWTQATLLYGVAYRRWLWPLVVLTLLTFYSRPYAGMHHVLDCLAGVGLGGVMGLLELAAASRLGLLRPPERASEPPAAAEPQPATPG